MSCSSRTAGRASMTFSGRIRLARTLAPPHSASARGAWLAPARAVRKIPWCSGAVGVSPYIVTLSSERGRAWQRFGELPCHVLIEGLEAGHSGQPVDDNIRLAMTCLRGSDLTEPPWRAGTTVNRFPLSMSCSRRHTRWIAGDEENLRRRSEDPETQPLLRLLNKITAGGQISPTLVLSRKVR